MARVLLALLTAGLLGAGCADEIQDRRTAQVDGRDPKVVTASIFHAAETGKTSHLRGLCDPRGENDEDTARICAMTPASPDWPSFRDNFARARLNGEPRISGDRALLHFLFGPDGKQSETMELVLRDGRWYLLSF